MGDKSPKDKNKKQAQKTTVDNRAKADRNKQQASLDRAPTKTK